MNSSFKQLHFQLSEVLQAYKNSSVTSPSAYSGPVLNADRETWHPRWRCLAGWSTESRFFKRISQLLSQSIGKSGWHRLDEIVIVWMVRTYSTRYAKTLWRFDFHELFLGKASIFGCGWGQLTRTEDICLYRLGDVSNVCAHAKCIFLWLPASRG